LRHDPVMAVLAGKLKARRKDCAPVAGKSTLSRLEHAPEEGAAFAPPRYHKISHDSRAIWTKGEANPRFIVTSLKRRQFSAQPLYEAIYCQRGDMVG
jgi:hypothetical protein